MATALTSARVVVDFIGSDELDVAELLRFAQLVFSICEEIKARKRIFRSENCTSGELLLRLIGYAATAKPKIFHILWNNKFEFFDRTLLMVYYRLLGRRIVFTAHNVNIRKRDNCDSWFNRLSLRIQYHLADHIFVHTERMKSELLADFGVPDRKISVIPFGINNTAPNTGMTSYRGEENVRREQQR